MITLHTKHTYITLQIENNLILFSTSTNSFLELCTVSGIKNYVCRIEVLEIWT